MPFYFPPYTNAGQPQQPQKGPNFGIMQNIQGPQVSGVIQPSAPEGGDDGGGFGELLEGLQGFIGGMKGMASGGGQGKFAPASTPQVSHPAPVSTGGTYGGQQAFVQPSMNKTPQQAALPQSLNNAQSLSSKPQSVIGNFKHGGPTVPEQIIFHDTAGPSLKSATTTLQQRGLSYNYIIDKDGSIHNLVPPGTKAYHAKGFNDKTVGVSFVGGGGFGSVNPAQQQAAIKLTTDLKSQFPTINGFAGHRDRSHAGKIDPEGFDYTGFEKATGLKFISGAGSERFKYQNNNQIKKDISNEPGFDTVEVPPLSKPQSPMQQFSNRMNQPAMPIAGQGSLLKTVNDNQTLKDLSTTPEFQSALSNKDPASSVMQVNKDGQSYQINTKNKSITSSVNDNPTTSLIAGYENFSPKTYWDVNHHRVGYGSDTITRADGSVVEVKRGMTVTREDAVRDLNRRTKEFQSGVISRVGEGAWNNLNPAQQAALTSIAYNYGSLPIGVAKAIKAGDIDGAAAFIRGTLAKHNKGTNRGRRNQEAMILATGQMPAKTYNGNPISGFTNSAPMDANVGNIPSPTLFADQMPPASVAAPQLARQPMGNFAARAMPQPNMIPNQSPMQAANQMPAMTPVAGKGVDWGILQQIIQQQQGQQPPQ